MKRTSLAVFLLACGFVLFATPSAHKHVVKKGETLYAICHEYGLKLNDLLHANPTIAKTRTIRPGEQLIIPSRHSAAVVMTPVKPEAPVKKVSKPAPVPSTPGVQYKDEDEQASNVHPSPATASIATETPVEATPGPTVVNGFSIKAGANPSDYQSLFNQYAPHGCNLVKTRGEANYLSENTSGNPYLALCNEAQIGSVIQVLNMMNQKSLYAKVVGRLSSIDASHEIVLKLSRQAATEIGAADDKFLVEVSGVK